MQQAYNQAAKNVITEIAVRRLEIQKLQKELCQLETEQREELTRRYCSE